MKPDQRSIHADHRAARFKYMAGAKPLAGYTIRRGIGIGGFGEVYFAVSDAGKEVALKRIQRNLDIELRGVQNCLNLKHVNLISLWDIRTDEQGESWVVMEYVPGPSLRDIIEVTENGMPLHQIRRWFEPIANGVEYLHEKGIVHRDLKPANIFLDEDENVIKIGDYGLSKFIECSHRSGHTETVGTFHYMAPEIGKGFYGKGIDIYAMGIVLYEMLTGTVPFVGESSQEIIMKHLTADPDLTRVPREFHEVIRRSMLKDPEARFDSIAAMRAFLPWENGSRIETVVAQVVEKPVRNRLNGQVSELLLPELRRQSLLDDGIRFGPLVDSTAGNPGPVPAEIHYIGETEIVAKNGTVSGQVPPEPIAAAVRSGVGRVHDWWNDTSVTTPLKLFVLVGAGLVIAANSEWLLPLALLLGLLYLVYIGFRALLGPATTEPGRGGPPVLSRREEKRLIHRGMRTHLASQEAVSRLTSLTGSLLTSAIICIALNVLGFAVSGSLVDSSVRTLAMAGASTLTCIFASWIVLGLGKYFECSDGEPLPRRMSMLVTGLLVGGIAFATASYLNVDFQAITVPGFNPLQENDLVFTGIGPLASCLLFFAAMFGLVRWYRMADPTRRTRLSLWSIGACVVLGAIIGHVMDFVPFWSSMMIAVIAIAIQLSAPWIPRWERQAFLRQV